MSSNDLSVGLAAQFERMVTEQDVLDFARISGDQNPLHVDANYAAETNYGRRIVHGAFQIGLASALIGMQLPGKRVLLSSVQAKFPAPLYFPTTVRVQGEIVAWNRGTQSGRLRVCVVDQAREAITAEISMGFSMHEDRQAQTAGHASQKFVSVEPPGFVARKSILVTGASGGIGSRLVSALSETFDVIATTNRAELPTELQASLRIHPVRLDFAQSDWPEIVRAALPSTLFGVVHCAWPSLAKGGLLNVPREVIEQQMAFGTTHLIELARVLTSRVSDGGGRLIAIGSIAGSQKPSVNLGAYSLGKAALEHTVRLIAAELAGKKITANAVCPNFVAVGMNGQADARRQKLEAAHVPMGRTCELEDILGIVQWLLSENAAFVSGQCIGINGAQL